MEPTKDGDKDRPPFPTWVKPTSHCSSCRGRNIMRNPDFYYSSTKGWIKTCSECLRKRKEKRERSLQGGKEEEGARRRTSGVSRSWEDTESVSTSDMQGEGKRRRKKSAAFTSGDVSELAEEVAASSFVEEPSSTPSVPQFNPFQHQQVYGPSYTSPFPYGGNNMFYPTYQLPLGYFNGSPMTTGTSQVPGGAAGPGFFPMQNVPFMHPGMAYIQPYAPARSPFTSRFNSAGTSDGIVLPDPRMEMSPSPTPVPVVASRPSFTFNNNVSAGESVDGSNQFNSSMRGEPHESHTMRGSDAGLPQKNRMMSMQSQEGVPPPKIVATASPHTAFDGIIPVMGLHAGEQARGVDSKNIFKPAPEEKRIESLYNSGEGSSQMEIIPTAPPKSPNNSGLPQSMTSLFLPTPDRRS